ncbi:flavin-containing monooxygenase, partial [Micromonosporaceae bacterium Da 78-11]
MSQERVRIVIVGAGFSGLAMAIRLKKRGMHDFVILEKAPDVGGAWHHNTYPGCRCDIPSHLYSMSFAPNPNWSHTYSGQAEIQDYLRGCADRFGLRPHLRTGEELRSATWREDAGRWEIETGSAAYVAEILIGGLGPLHEPLTPQLPGLSRFQGKTMHSARWDHDYDLTGKRVASIGTGASAIQYVPEIQPQVDRLVVFQRTAPWIMPHGNRPISDRERALYRRVPLAQRAVRGAVYSARELLVLGFVKRPKIMERLAGAARAHLAKQVADPQLRARLTPDYTFGCKRLLPSNRWYPALTKPNVSLVTAGIQEVREHSVVDADGREHEVDAIIFGTGFHVTDMPVADRIRGRSGVLLKDAWAGGPRAYLGTSVPGFPNMFLLLGPNTGLGHGSMVYMIESQVRHVLHTIRTMDRKKARMAEVDPAAYQRYNRDVDTRLGGTVWNTGGCASFYFDAGGRNATLWPDWTWRFRRLAKRDAYLMTNDHRTAEVT